LVAFPTVHALAKAHIDHVLKVWEGLGYYTRARNLHKAARIIACERGGQFPRSAAEWQDLPGVGRYTSGAIASITLREQVAVLDGNVKRVLSRLFNIAESIDEGKTEQHLWFLAQALVPAKAPGDFNQAMMELGARVCTPKKPKCGQCPIRNHCDAHRAGVQEQRPVRRAKKKTPHHEIVVGVICKRGWFLIGKRPPAGLLGGLWEFPGGKVRKSETHRQALVREIWEEMGIRVKVEGLVSVVDHAYSHFKVTLNVYRCSHLGGRLKPHAHTQLKWVPRAHFGRYAFPKANHKFLHLL